MSPSLTSLGCLAVLLLLSLNMVNLAQGLTEIFIGECVYRDNALTRDLKINPFYTDSYAIFPVSFQC